MFLRKTLPWVIVLTGLFTVLKMQSCRLDDFDASPSIKLAFSADSLLFDTVFTTIGSATRSFKVYNRSRSRISIESIELAGGNRSFFRINADGRSGTSFRDVELGPNDSLFVFVEVTVDPVGQDLPLIITDSVVFSTNGNLQNVKLVAWGQDANFIRPNYTDTVNGISVHLILEDTEWAGPKPYVVYGFVLVAPEATLTIQKGTNVHFHNRSAMVFYPESTFKVKGSLEEPVQLMGDRLESMYSDLPAQWGYIWLMAASRDHEIDHAIIKNATYGLIMDSIGSFTEPTLRISNTIIKNIDQTGLELNGAWVKAHNLVVANCGKHAILMQWGGRYEFYHTTVANYYNLPGAMRQTPSVVINNYYLDVDKKPQIRPIERVYFGNSIIHGSLQEEILLDLLPDNSHANLTIEHSLVRTTLQNQWRNYFNESIFNEQPRFHDAGNNDFRLNEDSPAIGKGSPNISIDFPVDILGNPREERSDMGAYQYFKIDEER